MTLEH
ncbi:unnamed protein product [Staurois parvus]